MLGDYVKRAFNGAVLTLAALTFFLVPVGKRTPAQHLFAILRSPPAEEAAASFAAAARSAARRATAEIDALRDERKPRPRAKVERGER